MQTEIDPFALVNLLAAEKRQMLGSLTEITPIPLKPQSTKEAKQINKTFF